MKIVLSEEAGFRSYDHVFCGIPSNLIIPEVDAKWTKDNLHFRSLIVDKDTNEVLSSGWPKFFNYGEKPDSYPNPESYDDWVIEEKMDGSLVICDYVNSQFSMRTRGTACYKSQNNYKDFELILEQYPKLVSFMKESGRHLSLLIEILTPNNPIVVLPQEVQFHLLGAIDKRTLTSLSVAEVDLISVNTDLPRPNLYNFDSILDLVDIVKQWKGQEGVVISYNNNQNRIKIKSDWYIWIHRIKSQLNSENNLIEFFVNEGMPNSESFYNIIQTNFDWEIAEQLKPRILKLADASIEVRCIIEKMESFIHTIRGFDTRKEQARYIISEYANEKSRSAMVFNLLDNKELSNEQLAILLYQVLSNKNEQHLQDRP